MSYKTCGDDFCQSLSIIACIGEGVIVSVMSHCIFLLNPFYVPRHVLEEAFKMLSHTKLSYIHKKINPSNTTAKSDI